MSDTTKTVPAYAAFCVGGRWYVRNNMDGTRCKCKSEESAKLIAERGTAKFGRVVVTK